MIRRPPRSTRTDTLFPYTTLFRSAILILEQSVGSALHMEHLFRVRADTAEQTEAGLDKKWPLRSEEHTSELQSLMRISYAVFCLKKKKRYKKHSVEHNKQHYHLKITPDIIKQQVSRYVRQL